MQVCDLHNQLLGVHIYFFTCIAQSVSYIIMLVHINHHAGV